ncbi:MAG: GNAT family N-acetyltransferase [Chloroflexota bacterium]
MIVRENLTIRPYQMSDVQALAEIANAVNEAIGSEHRTNASEMRSYFELPSFDIANDSFVIERGGQIVGMTDLEFSAASGRSWVDGRVHPDFWRQGIGAQLISLTEARVLERGEAECAPEQPISLHRHAVDTNTAAIRLFKARGYSHVRSYYRMRKALDQPINVAGDAVPPLPGGLVLRPFDEARDARTVYEAHEEAFEDHWGFERDSFEDWVHYKLRRPGADTSMWLVAYDGDEIAGMCLSRPYSEHEPELAYVNVLGVRRPWRKQGLGSALLQQSFALFQERGFRHAGLGVDSSSLTNAVALYERAGMHVHEREGAYRKMLRGEASEG